MSIVSKSHVKLFDKYNKVSYMDKDTRRGSVTLWCALLGPGIFIGITILSLISNLALSIMFVLIAEIVLVSVVTILFSDIDPYRYMSHARKKTGNENYIDSTDFVANALKFLGHRMNVIDMDVIVDDSTLVYICDTVSDSDVEKSQKVAMKYGADSIYILTCYHTDKHISSGADVLADTCGISIVNFADVLWTVHNKIQLEQS